LYVVELVRVVEADELFEKVEEVLWAGSRRSTTEHATSAETRMAKLSLKMK